MKDESEEVVQEKSTVVSKDSFIGQRWKDWDCWYCWRCWAPQ